MYVCAHMHTHECRYQWKKEESVQSAGAGAISGCELPGIGAGNQLRPSGKQYVLLIA